MILKPFMKLHYLVMVLLISGCNTEQHTYLEAIQAGTIIHRSLYSVAVPLSSSKDIRQWDRYSRNGKSDDLVLKHSEGYPLPSYAVSIEVKRQITIGNLTDLKTYVANPEYPNLTEFKMFQPQLLCVRPSARKDAAPEKSFGFFAHTLLCIDTRNHNYYDMKVSYMTRRKGDIPPHDLSGMADNFFESFRVENY